MIRLNVLVIFSVIIFSVVVDSQYNKFLKDLEVAETHHEDGGGKKGHSSHYLTYGNKADKGYKSNHHHKNKDHGNQGHVLNSGHNNEKGKCFSLMY